MIGGKEHIIQQYRSLGAAEKDLPRFEEELHAMGPLEWARKHGVPVAEA
jgi:hypothetical protein